MKVLWICNIIIGDIANEMGLSFSPFGGWLSSAYKKLKGSDNEIVFLYPNKESVHYKNDNLEVFGFKKASFNNYNELTDEFIRILKTTTPNIIHIHGTEYLHSYAMAVACQKSNLLDKTVVSIQGLVSVIANHYYSFLSNRIIKRKTFGDLYFKRKSIKAQKNDFEKRGEFEEKSLKIVKHVIGRTDWDRACVEKINPYIEYHFCGESLRDSFYENSWSLDNCEKYSIFVSQSNYPLKGFHLMLEAFSDILSVYPSAKLYTTGRNIVDLSFKSVLALSSYEKYLMDLILKYNLQNNVVFIGRLDENAMCERMKTAHVFVSPSSIENSSNSLGEAMTLGVPCVASDVGGTSSILTHNKEGFLYQSNAPYMLAFYVMKIFENDELALKLSIEAKERAKHQYDRVDNYKTLIEIYKLIR